MLKQDKDNIMETEVTDKSDTKIKDSYDKPTEPTYPWRKPSKTDEVYFGISSN